MGFLKKALIVAGILYFSFFCDAFDIVKDGRALCVIVTPDNPGPPVTDAVKCLNRYIKKISGVELKVVPESGMPSSGNMIVLGSTRCAREEGIDVSRIKYDGFIHKVSGRKFFIAGPDREFKIKDSQNPVLEMRKRAWNQSEGRRGTLNGVIRFLYNYCGVRWFIPTPKGEKVPVSKNISAPDGLDAKEEPPFESAFAAPGLLWAYKPGFYWAMANSFRISVNYFPNGGHLWDPAIKILSGSPEKLFKKHPEYFYYKNGARRWKEKGNYFCTSNIGLQDYLYRTLEKIFGLGWNIVEYGQSDGFTPSTRCECDKCEAMDEYRPGPGKDRPCERLLVPFNEIAKRCYKAYPDRKILMLVYGPATVASEKIKKFSGNVLLSICGPDRRKLEAWKDKAPLYAVWQYWLGCYQQPGISVKSSPAFAAKQVNFLRQYDLKMLFWCFGGAGENWGNEGPVYYVTGQLLRNPSADCDKLLNEYYDWVYAEASDVMKRYFTLLYARLDELYLKDDSYKGKGSIKTPEEFFTTIYTPAFLSQLEELLKEAQKLIKNENSGKWLALTIDQFEYIETTANVFHKYKIFRKENDIKSLNELKQAVEARRKYIKRLKGYAKDKTYIKNWYPGYDGIVKYASAGGRMRGELRAPFTWNFDRPEKLLEKSVETVLGKTPQPVLLDGKLDEPAWNESAWNGICEMSGGSFDYKTAVKLTYDNDNLYLGFECGEPDIEKMKIKKRDRDGRVWRDECIEIFLDPEGAGDKYMHFVLNPEKGCFYDARKGYIKDPLHPLFNAEDAEWNVDWNYACSIDKKNKKWTLEIAIPFKSLGVSPPVPGTVWKGNFGRARWLGGKRAGEFSLWSPNFKNGAFNSASAFGSIHFGNLFENPGFEKQGSVSGELPGWLNRGACIEKKKIHSGSYAVELKAASEVKSRQLIFVRSLPVEASGGGRYRAAAWIDIPEDLAQMPRDRRQWKPGFNIAVKAYDKSGKQIKGIELLSRYRKTDGWVEVSGECELPAETEKVLIFFILREYNASGGNVYVDDASFIKLDSSGNIQK